MRTNLLSRRPAAWPCRAFPLPLVTAIISLPPLFTGCAGHTRSLPPSQTAQSERAAVGGAPGDDRTATPQPAYADAVATAPNGSDGLRFTVDGQLLYGPVQGFLQTPAGGQPGSTTRNLPPAELLLITP